MASNYNPRDEVPYYHSNGSDIELSTWEYHDFIDCLLDDRLTPSGLMKFKRMHEINSMNLVLVPVLTFPLAYWSQKWLVGK